MSNTTHCTKCFKGRVNVSLEDYKLLQEGCVGGYIVLCTDCKKVEEDEIDGPIFHKYQDDYITEKFGDEYDWTLKKESWSTFFHDVLFSDGENTINGVWVGLREDRDAEEEEEICPSCGDQWTEATRCDCPNEESVE